MTDDTSNLENNLENNPENNPVNTERNPETAGAGERTSFAAPTELYLLIGQSNMAGRAPIEEADRVPLDNVALFTVDDTWEPASNDPLGLNRYSSVEEAVPEKTLLGPGYTFGRRLVELTGRPIGLVVNARGGTRIGQWRTTDHDGDFPLYAEAVRRGRAALEATPGARFRGILWHQGEGDNNADAESYYLPTLATIVSGLRTELDAPDAVFVAGEVGRWQGRGQYINPLLQRVSEVIPNSGWVSAEGLTTHETDRDPWGPHFDTESQRELGRRYAEAVAALLTRPS